jgi:YidC/Oxa1 family membrane protein insertase
VTNQGGQEQRAFLAILLAMGVILVWSYLFPAGPPPRNQTGTEASPSEEVAAVTEPGAEEVAPFTAPGEASDTALADSAAAGDRSEAGSLLGLTRGSTQLTADERFDREHVEVVGTDVRLVLDSRGARVTEVELLGYEGREGGPVQLLPRDGPGALGSVLVHDGRDIPLDGFDFRLVSNEATPAGRRVVFELPLREVTLRKTFTVPAEGNVLQVDQEILDDRLGLGAWGLSWAGGMRVTEERLGTQRGPYFQGTVFAEGEVQRKDPSKARKEPIEFPGATRFVGIQNKYFLGAIVPRGDQQGPARLWRVPLGSGSDEEASLAGEILVERTPGLASNQVTYDVYVGPLDYAKLKALDLGIEGAVDLGFSWIRPLSRVILSVVIGLHSIIPNYGVVIIVFALGMNLLFLPLTWKSTKSMRDMSALKPRLDALKEKYKDEPQKMSEATMRLYKEAGVNPLAGCLPLFIQMPIFFALYAVLIRTIELRQEPFVFWIRDLSQPDVVFNLPFSLPLIGTGVCLLPVIMGVTSYFQSKQTMVDPNQKAMLIMMPVMMTFIFFTMPSGLVLYWLVSNVFTISSKFFMKPSAVAESIAEEAEAPAGKGGKGRKAGGGSRRRGSKRPARAGAKG